MASRSASVPAIAHAAGPVATAFTDQHGYIASALARAASSLPTQQSLPTQHTAWTAPGVLIGLAAAVLAVLVALAGLYVRRVPTWLTRPVAVLHRAHSGHIGDYAAWLVFGAAAFGGLLLIG